jgi:hypothetical protein
MSFLRRVSVGAVSAAVVLSASLLASFPVASGQDASTGVGALPPSCTSLVGGTFAPDAANDNGVGEYNSGFYMGPSSIQAIGYFTTDANLDLTPYKEFVFEYTVPDQTGTDYPGAPVPYETPNHVRFALYTNPDLGQSNPGGNLGDGSTNGNTGPLLVADSKQVSIKDVVGPQTLVARIRNHPRKLLPSTQYILGQ